MHDLFTDTGAVFSPCQRYRYKLWRIWEYEAGLVNFLMLNPSTADEHRNDPTVERCERRVRAWGYGGLVVTNLFAWRATDPKEMLVAEEPVGPENDTAILTAADNCRLVVCAWGTSGDHQGRSCAVTQMLHRAGVQPWALRITKGGHPEHPLYLPYDSRLVPFGARSEALG